MDSSMGSQISLLSKRFITCLKDLLAKFITLITFITIYEQKIYYLTREWLFTGVRSLMNLQQEYSGKALSTNERIFIVLVFYLVALVILNIFMKNIVIWLTRPHVTHECGFSPVCVL